MEVGTSVARPPSVEGKRPDRDFALPARDEPVVQPLRPLFLPAQRALWRWRRSRGCPPWPPKGHLLPARSAGIAVSGALASRGVVKGRAVLQPARGQGDGSALQPCQQGIGFLPQGGPPEVHRTPGRTSESRA